LKSNRTQANDVHSLAKVISEVYREVRIPGNVGVEQGLSTDPSQRPTARELMNALILQRSHFGIESDNSKKIIEI